MTARNLAKLLAKPGAADAYVVLPLTEYNRLREALDDARDLAGLQEARRENAGKPLVPWSDVKRSLGLGEQSTKRARPRISKRRAA